MDAGSAGLSVAHQISDRFEAAGKFLGKDDIAIVDAAEYHNYQVRIISSQATFNNVNNMLHSLDGMFYRAHRFQSKHPDSWVSFRTLVGAGLRPKTDFRRPLSSLISSSLITHIPEHVSTFSPTSSSLTTASGRSLTYDALVIAAGLQINWNAIPGLSKALAEPTSGVSSIYSYDTCDKVWNDIESLRNGSAIFTQPAGIIKCAGGIYM